MIYRDCPLPPALARSSTDYEVGCGDKIYSRKHDFLLRSQCHIRKYACHLSLVGSLSERHGRTVRRCPEPYPCVLRQFQCLVDQGRGQGSLHPLLSPVDRKIVLANQSCGCTGKILLCLTKRFQFCRLISFQCLGQGQNMIWQSNQIDTILSCQVKKGQVCHWAIYFTSKKLSGTTQQSDILIFLV